MSKTAFIFPGQGSQSVGMLLPAHEAWPQVADTFAEASDVLGFDLWQMACDGPAETLSLTANTQPLILTASVALFRAYRALGGPMPAVAAGHSLGEFSALVAANSLDFSDAVRLVRQRGEAMQVSVPVGVGAMAAIIGLDDDTINATCATISRSNEHVVLAVNYNSPGQVVIAGTLGCSRRSRCGVEGGRRQASVASARQRTFPHPPYDACWRRVERGTRDYRST